MDEARKYLKVTTESGRDYLLDLEGGFWRRLPKSAGEYSGGWERTWSLQRGTHFDFPWNSPEGTWKEGLPEVGKFMFVSAKDVWWTSTKVICIEEVTEEDLS